MVAGSGLWPVRCAPVGLVAVGSVLWRYSGALHCTAIGWAAEESMRTGKAVDVIQYD